MRTGQEALLRAYFTDARNAAEVHADMEQAQAYGATGVPFFAVDQKYCVSGAQPVEAFTQVLERTWADSHPAIEMVTGGEECGPDGCAI